MIPDKPLKAAIITSILASLWMPAGAYADTETIDGDTPASAGMTATATSPLPHINTLESSPRVMQFIPLNHVFFDHNAAVLNQRSKSILDDAAQYILLTDNIERVIIHGHANSVATKDYNDRLSDKRANTVKDYLINKKVPVDLMWVTGWGENDPIDENWMRAGSQRNRRVEIYLVQHNQKE